MGNIRQEPGERYNNSATSVQPALSMLGDKPSIAVLPFSNFSSDPEQSYFADGMVDDIITALCHIRWLFVIARTSSFTYRDRAVDVRQIGCELGVRYVVVDPRCSPDVEAHLGGAVIFRGDELLILDLSEPV